MSICQGFLGRCPRWPHPLFELRIEVVNPPDCLAVGDLPEVPLGRGQVCVPEDDLAHDLHRDPGSGCMGGSIELGEDFVSGDFGINLFDVPEEVVRPRTIKGSGFGDDLEVDGTVSATVFGYQGDDRFAGPKDDVVDQNMIGGAVHRNDNIDAQRVVQLEQGVF